MFGRKREKKPGRIPWKKIAAATGLCLFAAVFVVVFGKLLPQGGHSAEDPDGEDVKNTEKKRTKKTSRKTKNTAVQCLIVTTALFVLIVACWIFWEKPWRRGEDQGEVVYLDLPTDEERIIPAEQYTEGAGAADVTEIVGEETEQTVTDDEDAVPEDAAASSEEEVPEDEMTVLIETTEPLPQPQVAYVGTETITAHRTAVAGDIVFVGDSRTVGMSTAVPSGDIYIAKVGAGYDWFASTAVPEVDGTCSEGTIIVINMGVNDLGNAIKYANKVNACIDDWSARGIHVAYMSVNPVVDGHSNASNAKVERFNSIVRGALDPRIAWIDTYSSLVANGYATQDGLHYKNATYRQIYDLCLSSLSVLFPPVMPDGEDSISENEADPAVSVSENEAGTDPSVSENAAQGEQTVPDNGGTQQPDTGGEGNVAPETGTTE